MGIQSKPVRTMQDLSDALCETCPPDEHLSGNEPVYIYNIHTEQRQRILCMEWSEGMLIISVEDNPS